nr:uncharacterized protein LOC117280762 [Nicotiana tomentosiformis]
MEKETCPIKSWDRFKFELKRQFYPQNVLNEARRRLREFRQTTSINWARQELQRRQVQDVDEYITVAESLNDYRTETTKARDTNFQPDGDHGYRDKDKQVDAPDRDSREQGNKAHWRDRYNQRRKEVGPCNGCYICKDTSHGYKDCFSLKKFGAIITAERRLTEERIQADEQAKAEVQPPSCVAHLGNMVKGAVVPEKPALKQVA